MYRSRFLKQILILQIVEIYEFCTLLHRSNFRNPTEFVLNLVSSVEVCAFLCDLLLGYVPCKRSSVSNAFHYDCLLALCMNVCYAMLASPCFFHMRGERCPLQPVVTTQRTSPCRGVQTRWRGLLACVRSSSKSVPGRRRR